MNNTLQKRKVLSYATTACTYLRESGVRVKNHTSEWEIGVLSVKIDDGYDDGWNTST